jgi:hypothetical protein
MPLKPKPAIALTLAGAATLTLVGLANIAGAEPADGRPNQTTPGTAPGSTTLYLPAIYKSGPTTLP